MDESTNSQRQEPKSPFTNGYQPPQGAIPPRLKVIAVAVGLPVMLLLTIYGSCHHEPATPSRQRATVVPMSPQSIDQQEADMRRQLAEAERLRGEAEAAKRRAEESMDNGGRYPVPSQSPQQRSGQDPEAALRQQLRQEQLKRSYTAPFASSLVYAAQKTETETTSTNNVTAQPAPARQEPQVQSAMPIADAPSKANPYPFDSADGPNYRIFEGKILEAVLENRLEGSFTGPVICHLSTAVYDNDGANLLIPKGSRVLGEAHAVGGGFDTRLAVFFHRITMDDGYSVSLDQFKGLDQIGSTGLKDKVDRHYLSIFGTSLALGGIAGLSQIGAYSGGGSNGAFYGFQLGLSEQMAASANQVLSHFLNRMPTVTIREGQRIKIELSNDLLLPAYADHTIKRGI